MDKYLPAASVRVKNFGIRIVKLNPATTGAIQASLDALASVATAVNSPHFTTDDLLGVLNTNSPIAGITLTLLETILEWSEAQAA